MKEGHLPNTGTLTIELHRLLTMFLASKPLADLRTMYPGEGHDPIYRIQEVEEDELTRLLLTLAITARVVDDREGRLFDLIGLACGSLQADVSRPGTIELGLRDACNKIIHARKIRIELAESEKTQPYWLPWINLYGQSKPATEWHARLDVVEFAKAYMLLVMEF